MSKNSFFLGHNGLGLILISICSVALSSCCGDKDSTKAPNHWRKVGKEIIRSAIDAARIRLRPILMTAFALILGVVLLVVPSAAGVNSRDSLSTPVFGGMIISTFLSLIVVPVFYVLIEKLRERRFEKQRSGT